MFDAAAIKYIAIKKVISSIEFAYWNLVDSNLGEPNDEVLRKVFHTVITEICKQAVFSNDMDEFTVTCDETNNSPDYIDRLKGWPSVVVAFKILKTHKNLLTIVLERPENLDIFSKEGKVT